MKMKTMRLLKRVSALLCLLLCAAVLAGCTALPEGVDAGVIEEKAKQAVDLVNARDFEGLIASMREDAQEVADPEAWAAAVNPTLDEAGAFVEYTGTSVAGQEQEGEKFVAAVVTAKYENANLVFSLAFDADSQLTGFWVRPG